VAGTGNTGEDRAGSRQADERGIEDLVLATRCRGDGTGPDDQGGKQAEGDGQANGSDHAL
jgi:hypothetical protein